MKNKCLFTGNLGLFLSRKIKYLSRTNIKLFSKFKFPVSQDNLFKQGDRNVEFPVKGREIGQGYISDKNKTSEVGLVLIQEWWGLNRSITITADRFSEKGFRVLCPDIYRGKVSKDHEEAGHLMQGLDFAGAVKDISAAGEFLKSQGCKKVGITGFCMGGALTFATLSESNVFYAGVPFYGVPDLNKFPLKNIKLPVLAHFGAMDQMKGFSDPELAKHIKTQAKALGVNIKIHIWDGAGHAFMNQDNSNYNPEVAKKALEETVKFFQSH